MTFDPSQDFQIFDGSETVTYCQVGGSPVTVSGALREQLTTHEAQAGAAVGLQPTDVPFNLPAPNLSGIVPANGDSFVDAGGATWIVVAVQYDMLIKQYRVMCRQGR